MVTDLYGFTSAKLADLTDILKEILGVQFVFRSSDFFGDYYRSTPESTENIRLVLRECFKCQERAKRRAIKWTIAA